MRALLAASARPCESGADTFAARTLRAAIKGERGVIAQAAAGKTLRSLIGLGWTFSSTRSLREVFPDSVQSDPESLVRAYCEEGASRPAMELRLLRMYRVMLGPEFRAMFNSDGLSEGVAQFEAAQQDLPELQLPQSTNKQAMRKSLAIFVVVLGSIAVPREVSKSRAEGRGAPRQQHPGRPCGLGRGARRRSGMGGRNRDQPAI